MGSPREGERAPSQHNHNGLTNEALVEHLLEAPHRPDSGCDYGKITPGNLHGTVSPDPMPPPRFSLSSFPFPANRTPPPQLGHPST